MALIDNLVAYWSLDEASGNAIDAHGSNDLTDTNTVGAGTGKVSGARDFETDNIEYFVISDNADLSMGDIDMSVSMWLKWESAPAANIIGKTGTEYQFYFFSNSLRLNINGADRVTHSFTPTLGQWYHVVFWHDAVNNIVGITVDDGTPTTAAYSGGIPDSNRPFAIGTNADFTGDEFDGLIDEVGIWKRILSAAEITDLYNAGSGRDYAYIAATGGPPDVYLSQLPIEVLTDGDDSLLRLSQLSVEVLITPVADEVRLSQYSIEVLTDFELTPATEVAITHLVVEYFKTDVSAVRVTQLLVEIIYRPGVLAPPSSSEPACPIDFPTDAASTNTCSPVLDEGDSSGSDGCRGTL